MNLRRRGSRGIKRVGDGDQGRSRSLEEAQCGRIRKGGRILVRVRVREVHPPGQGTHAEARGTWSHRSRCVCWHCHASPTQRSEDVFKRLDTGEESPSPTPLFIQTYVAQKKSAAAVCGGLVPGKPPFLSFELNGELFRAPRFSVWVQSSIAVVEMRLLLFAPASP